MIMKGGIIPGVQVMRPGIVRRGDNSAKKSYHTN